MNRRQIIILAAQLKHEYRWLMAAATVHNALVVEHSAGIRGYLADVSITHCTDTAIESTLTDLRTEASCANREFWLFYESVKNLHEKLFDAMNSGISHAEFLRIVQWIEESP